MYVSVHVYMPLQAIKSMLTYKINKFLISIKNIYFWFFTFYSFSADAKIDYRAFAFW